MGTVCILTYGEPEKGKDIPVTNELNSYNRGRHIVKKAFFASRRNVEILELENQVSLGFVPASPTPIEGGRSVNHKKHWSIRYPKV